MHKEKIEEPKIEEPKIAGKIEIFMLSDGNVMVGGPLKNTALIINIFGKALEAIAGFMSKEEGSVVVPTPRLKV